MHNAVIAHERVLRGRVGCGSGMPSTQIETINTDLLAFINI